MSIISNYLKQNKVTHTFESCQWPIGDPQEKDFHFCEAKTLNSKPYCQKHCDINIKDVLKFSIIILLCFFQY